MPTWLHLCRRRLNGGSGRAPAAWCFTAGRQSSQQRAHAAETELGALRRLWFDRRVPMRFPANVLSGFDDTMGSTFFDLNDLQVGRCLWGGCVIPKGFT